MQASYDRIHICPDVCRRRPGDTMLIVTVVTRPAALTARTPNTYAVPGSIRAEVALTDVAWLVGILRVSEC